MIDQKVEWIGKKLAEEHIRQTFYIKHHSRDDRDILFIFAAEYE